MIKLNNDFLIEIGLGSLSPSEKNKMLNHIYETLEGRVGMHLAERMSEKQLTEFEDFIKRQDQQGALQWLESNFPDYRQVVSDELDKLKEEIRQVAPKIVAQSQQAQVSEPAQPTTSAGPAAAQPQFQQPAQPAAQQQQYQQSAPIQPMQQAPTPYPYPQQQPAFQPPQSSPVPGQSQPQFQQPAQQPQPAMYAPHPTNGNVQPQVQSYDNNVTQPMQQSMPSDQLFAETKTQPYTGDSSANAVNNPYVPPPQQQPTYPQTENNQQQSSQSYPSQLSPDNESPSLDQGPYQQPLTPPKWQPPTQQ